MKKIVTNRDYSVDDVFSLSKAIINPTTGEVYGVVLMDIRHDIIWESINSVPMGQKGFVFAADLKNTLCMVKCKFSRKIPAKRSRI